MDPREIQLAREMKPAAPRETMTLPRQKFHGRVYLVNFNGRIKPSAESPEVATCRVRFSPLNRRGSLRVCVNEKKKKTKSKFGSFVTESSDFQQDAVPVIAQSNSRGVSPTE